MIKNDLNWSTTGMYIVHGQYISRSDAIKVKIRNERKCELNFHLHRHTVYLKVAEYDENKMLINSKQ